MNLDLSVLWVIGFVLLLTAVVNRLLFRPVLRVAHERAQAIGSARALADESAARARAAVEEFEGKTASARAEVYKVMDERRREALAYRADVLAQTRQDAETQLRQATTELDRARRAARTALETDARSLGDAIVARVLERTS